MPIDNVTGHSYPASWTQEMLEAYRRQEMAAIQASFDLEIDTVPNPARTPQVIRNWIHRPASEIEGIAVTSLLKLKLKPKPRLKCKRCHNRQRACRNCGEKCRTCCPCKLYCKECRGYFKYYRHCRFCAGCPRHCGCVMQKPRVKGRINLLARPLGVELEMIQTDEMSGHWKTGFGNWEHDGTIRPSGLELVLPPASGDVFLGQIYKTYEQIIRYGADVNESCGFHVHVQAGDLNAQEIRRLIVLWCKIEKEVYRYLIAPHRLTNSGSVRYSMPLSTETIGERAAWQFNAANLTALMRKRYDTPTKIKLAIIKKLYALDLNRPQQQSNPKEEYMRAIQKYKQAAAQFERWKQNKRTPGQAEGGGCRYAALNLHSLFHRGTVEFRLKEGTILPEDLIFWPLFCGWIIETLDKLTDKDVGKIHGLFDWVQATKRWVQPPVGEWVVGRMK